MLAVATIWAHRRSGELELVHLLLGQVVRVGHPQLDGPVLVRLRLVELGPYALQLGLLGVEGGLLPVQSGLRQPFINQG